MQSAENKTLLCFDSFWEIIVYIKRWVKIKLVQLSQNGLQYLADVLESVLPLYSPIMPGIFEKQIEKYRTTQELPVNYSVWIIEHGGKRVGFLGFAGMTYEVGYLVALYIHADYHRMGYGGKALELLCRKLLQEGYKELVLFAHQQAEWAVNFYLKHGFEVVSTDLPEICKYRNGLLAQIAFPRIALMRRELHHLER